MPNAPNNQTNFDFYIEMEDAGYYQVKSIVKAFRLMEFLVSKREFQLAELSRLLESPKTTTLRILLTLESLGYVKQNQQSRGYMASMKIFELGRKTVQNLDLLQVAKPLMIKLSMNVGETINLGILDDTDVICIDKVESKQYLKIDQPIGSRAKAYHAAMGKAILAFLSEEERVAFFAGHTIKTTPNSLKTVSAILEDLGRVRERGYSVDNEEYMTGIRCVGAPIFDHNSSVVAGLSITFPASRIKMEDIEPLAKLVVEMAALISNNLGNFSSVVTNGVHQRS